jgi:hypothetical protein
VRDGQPPSDQQIERFVRLVAAEPGPVYLHCGAGVGRTGAMAGAYLLRTGRASRRAALARNLAIGPPSIEQLAFVAAGADGPPPWPVVAVSRVADAPRRLWSRLRALLRRRGWTGIPPGGTLTRCPPVSPPHAAAPDDRSAPGRGEARPR